MAFLLRSYLFRLLYSTCTWKAIFHSLGLGNFLVQSYWKCFLCLRCGILLFLLCPWFTVMVYSCYPKKSCMRCHFVFFLISHFPRLNNPCFPVLVLFSIWSIVPVSFITELNWINGIIPSQLHFRILCHQNFCLFTEFYFSIASWHSYITWLLVYVPFGVYYCSF